MTFSVHTNTKKKVIINKINNRVFNIKKTDFNHINKHSKMLKNFSKLLSK